MKSRIRRLNADRIRTWDLVFIFIEDIRHIRAIPEYLREIAVHIETRRDDSARTVEMDTDNMRLYPHHADDTVSIRSRIDRDRRSRLILYERNMVRRLGYIVVLIDSTYRDDV